MLITSVTGGGHLEVIEQNLQQLNNYTEMFLKQQTEGMDVFVEIKAMKHASNNKKKKYFKMMLECTMVMQHNCLLESKIKEQEVMKCLDALNYNDETYNNKKTEMTMIAIMMMTMKMVDKILGKREEFNMHHILVFF